MSKYDSWWCNYNPNSAAKRIAKLETTISTFLHDVDAAGDGLEMSSNMWLQVAAFRKLLKRGNEG